jgi:adenylate cyclase
VKNIAKPVGAYRVLMDPRVTVSGKPTDEKPSTMRRRSILVGAAAVLAVVIAVGIWYFYAPSTQPTEEAASVEDMAFTLPNKPSLVVLPFVNMSKDPDIEYLCDGLTETFISTLSKNPYVFVIASTSSFSYKGKPIKVNKVAEELGVQYVIEGSVQKSKDRLRIAIQIVDALTGRHILAERFDRSLKDLFKLQDEIIFEILKSVQTTRGKVDRLESWMVVGTNSLEAHLKYLEALYNFRFFTEERVIKAKQLFEEAIALDNDFAKAHMYLALVYNELGRYYSSGETRRRNFEEALKLTKKAIELDNFLSDAYAVLGSSFLFQKKYEKAIANLKKGIKVDPANPWAHSEMAQGFFFSNRPEEAAYHAKEAVRLDPLAPTHTLRLGRAYYQLRQYENAIRAQKKAIKLGQRVPSNPRWPHLHLAMNYAELGRAEEARAQMKKVLEYYPRFNLEERRRTLFFKDPAETEREIEALRKAGAPEKPPS